MYSLTIRHCAGGLVAAIVLALPPPSWAAPADQLRAGQAARTRAGLEELPRALGHDVAAPVSSAGSEELSLAEFSKQAERHDAASRPVYRLITDRPVAIPLDGFWALDQKTLVIPLSNDGDAVLVQDYPLGLRVIDGRTGAILKEPWDTEGKIALGDPDAPPRLELALGRHSTGDAVLHLRGLSANGTYLRVDQVTAMLEYLRASPFAGPSTTLGTGLEEEGAGEEVRVTLVGSPKIREYLAKQLLDGHGKPVAKLPRATVDYRGMATVQASLPWPDGRLDDVVVWVRQVPRMTAIAGCLREFDEAATLAQAHGAALAVNVVAPQEVGQVIQQHLARRVRERELAGSIVTATPAPGFVAAQAWAALDRRRGGLPKGQLFNPKDRAFTVLVASLASSGIAEQVAQLLTMDRPFAEHPTGGLSAYMALKRLGEPVPEPTITDLSMARSYIWRLEEVVRRRVLAMDAVGLSALRTAVGEIAFGQSLTPEWSRAFVVATNELNQLRTRAELVEFLRALNGGRQLVTLSPWQIEVLWVPGAPSWGFTITRGDRRLSAWEQALLKRFAVRLTLAAPGPAMSVRQPLTVNEQGASARFLFEQLEINADQMREAMAEQRLRVIFTGPGLPEVETGLEEATVEQATRAEADPTLEHYY